MATRLYPHTENVALLELLAEVPAGTHARLIVFHAERAAAERVEEARIRVLLPLARWAGKATHEMEEEAFYGGSLRTHELVAKDVELARLGDFLTYGWGRLQGWHHAEAAGHHAYAGATAYPVLIRQLLWSQHRVHDPERVAALLAEHGAGLCWS